MNQPDAASSRPSHHLSRNESFVILMCAVTPSMIYSTMMPVLPKIQAALVTNPDDAMLVRLAMTIVGVAMMIGAPLAGWIIDRIGVRLLLISSVLIWVALGCLGFWISDLHVLIAMRFIQGVTAVASVIVGTTLVGKISDEIHRGRLMGYSIMISAMAGVLIMTLAGIIGDFDWRYTFFLHLLYLPMLVSAFMLPKDKVIARTTTLSAVDHGFWQNFPYGLALISFLAGICTYVEGYMPYLYHDIGIEKSSQISVGLTAYTITAALSAALFGLSRRWLSAAWSFKLSFIITAAGLLLAAAFPSYLVTTAGQLVFGIGAGGMLPNIFGISSGAPVAYRGRITGMMKGLFCGAASAMTIIFEPIMHLGGARAVIMTIAGIGLAVAAGIAIAWRRHEQPDTTQFHEQVAPVPAGE